MKKYILVLRLFAIVVVLLEQVLNISAQLPYPTLVGYWHNWDAQNNPYIELDQVDSRYNVVNVAFGIPINGTDYEIGFTPDQVTQATFISQLQTLQNQGRKVLLSLGGATGPIKLDNTTERDAFVSSISSLINNYGFDGIDIDIEGSSLTISGGTIANPIDDHIIHLIDAIKAIMMNYHIANNNKLILTFAPETAHVQGGQSAWSSVWGAYLPVLHALRDSLDLIHVQLYNSGSMYGIDGSIYSQGTADFIVAMTEATIQGFDVDRWSNQAGPFIGFPAEKIAVGLPACPNAAGGGFVDTTTVADAILYLRGIGPQPGSYSLVNSGGYPNLAGMMTWSVNWDNLNTCNNSAGQFAENFERIFLTSFPVGLLSFTAKLESYGHVILQWSTASEINNDYFSLERSADVKYWETLQQIAGAQNSFSSQTYKYIDTNPLTYQSYYRLKQVDIDGKYIYSPIVGISNIEDIVFSIYPNPAKDFISISFNCQDEYLNIQLYNNFGQAVLQSKVSSNERISLVDFPSGTYYLVAIDRNNMRTYQRVEIIK